MTTEVIFYAGLALLGSVAAMLGVPLLRTTSRRSVAWSTAATVPGSIWFWESAYRAWALGEKVPLPALGHILYLGIVLGAFAFWRSFRLAQTEPARTSAKAVRLLQLVAWAATGAFAHVIGASV